MAERSEARRGRRAFNPCLPPDTRGEVAERSEAGRGRLVPNMSSARPRPAAFGVHPPPRQGEGKSSEKKTAEDFSAVLSYIISMILPRSFL